MKQSADQLIALIQSDMYRYHGDFSWKRFIFLLQKQKGFVASCAYRVSRFCYVNNYKFLFYISKIYCRYLQEHLCYELPHTCQIGPGLLIMHLHCLIVNSKCVFGRNIDMAHSVTVGAKPGGNNMGTPVLKDNVYLAPGSMVIGGITIESGVVVGAHAVVTKSLPENAVAVGIPAKIIGHGGSGEYCLNTDYDNHIKNLPPYEAC